RQRETSGAIGESSVVAPSSVEAEMHPFLTQSAVELAAMIKRGETTSEEVVGRHLDRLDEVNPALNAVVRVRRREALREAREADRILCERGPDGVGPFHGVPCTIKECFALEGM